MKTIRAITLLFALPLLAAISCSSVPEVSPAQRRTVQNKTFDRAGQESVFRAFKTVLQDEDAIILGQDVREGLIVAMIQSTKKNGSLWSAMSKETVKKYEIGGVLELNVHVYRRGPNSAEARVSFGRLERFFPAGWGGDEILTRELYEGLYQRVSAEVARRHTVKKK